MAALLQKRPNLVLVLLAGYFLLNLIVRLSLPDSLEIDEAEQIFVSQWLALGYDTQPPFYNWLQYGVIAVFGVSIPAIAVFKNLILFSFYAFYWFAARQVLQSRQLAVIAVLGLLTIPQVVYESQRDLTHTVGAIFCASMFLYGFLRTLRAPTIFSYALTGLAIGCGLIAKYNFALLTSAALIAVLLDPDLRKRLFDWRLLVTAVIALAVVTPHSLWLFDNLELASARTLEKMQGTTDTSIFLQIPKGFLSYFLALLGFGALTFFCFWLTFKEALIKSLTAQSQWTRLIGRILAMVLGFIVLLILFADAENIKDRWLTPFLILLPLYFALKLEAAGNIPQDALKRFLPIAFIIMAIVPLVLFSRSKVAYLTGYYEKLNVPYAAFTQTLVEEVGKTPALVIAGDPHLGGNIRLHMPDVPIDTLFYPGYKPAYQWTADHPIVFAWRRRGEPDPALPEDLSNWLKTIAGPDVKIEPKDVALPYISGRPGDLYHFSYAVVYPKAP
ncbi:glycosyltransferase family 39 protein [Rhizobium sp. LjRoot30]|uniref:ArnT family glycosyltransferase n=1 Tax=Rhizobium sp. LjRoot30 TaxID=3342320 RepID=UPI003ECCF5D5